MVINNNPCYAYLMRATTLVDQKLVMAHVYGHCDFFKNNDLVRPHQSQDDGRDGEPRQSHSPVHGRSWRGGGRGVHRRVPERRRPDRHPLAVHSPPRREESLRLRRRQERGRGADKPPRFQAKDYMDSFVNPREAMLAEEAERHGGIAAKTRRFPSGPSATCCCSCSSTPR